MTQLPLIFRPASRRSDPESSRLAERRHTQSGARGLQAMQVYAGCVRFPGLSSRELAAKMAEAGMPSADRYVCARRLPELDAADLVRREIGSDECRWWPR